MNRNQPIGVIDSGVGGLTVLKYLQKQLPHENFIFIGDTERTPYGDKSRDELISMVGDMTEWLNKKNIKLLVVACNTITVLGTEAIKGKYDFAVIGMSKGAALVKKYSKSKLVGVFATNFTVSTEVHKKAIQALDSEMHVFAQGCPKFVPLIERAQFDSPELTEAIEEYAEVLKRDGVDTVLLSCTHYPFVQEQVQKAFGPNVKVLDPAEITVQDAINYLKENELEKKEEFGRCDVCFTADIHRAQSLAARMLNMDKCQFHEIKIHK